MGGSARPLRGRVSCGKDCIAETRWSTIFLRQVLAFVATGAYTGYAPVAPATAGSLLAACVILFVAPESWLPYLLCSLLLTIAAVPLCGAAEGVFGPDGRPIVLDEWAGMFLSFLFLPRTLPLVVFGFLLFRIFDILKPFPAGRAQRLRGGWGVVADDVIAGIYTCLLLHVTVRIDMVSEYLR